MRKVSILLLLIFGAFFINTAYASSVKEEYELQERCKKGVETWFQKEGGKKGIHEDKDFVTVINYQNHYNKKLNRCFILVTTGVRDKKSKTDTLHYGLFDINENKQYADFLIDMKSRYKEGVGWVLEPGSSNAISCNEKGTWDKLVRPYMEE